MESLSKQLIDVEASDAVERASNRKAVEKLEVENDGLRALLCVWEERWRERNRLSEENHGMGEGRSNLVLEGDDLTRLRSQECLERQDGDEGGSWRRFLDTRCRICQSYSRSIE